MCMCFTFLPANPPVWLHHPPADDEKGLCRRGFLHVRYHVREVAYCDEIR
jgi:hypothetical protein